MHSIYENFMPSQLCLPKASRGNQFCLILLRNRCVSKFISVVAFDARWVSLCFGSSAFSWWVQGCVRLTVKNWLSHHKLAPEKERLLSTRKGGGNVATGNWQTAEAARSEKPRAVLSPDSTPKSSNTKEEKTFYGFNKSKRKNSPKE